MTDTTYCGFPSDHGGYVQGQLPAELAGKIEHSGQLQNAGYDVVVFLDSSGVVVAGDAGPEKDQIHLRDWRPDPPDADGWQLAWRAENDQGEANVTWYRPRQGDVATHEVFDTF